LETCEILGFYDSESGLLTVV